MVVAPSENRTPSMVVAPSENRTPSSTASIHTVQSESTMATEDEYTHLLPVIESLPAELSVGEHTDAIQFIKHYSRVFSKNEFDLG